MDGTAVGMIRQQLLLEETHVVWLKAQGPSVSETVRELVNRAMDGKPSVKGVLELEATIQTLRSDVDHLISDMAGVKRNGHDV